MLRHTLPSLNPPLVPCVFFYSKMPTKRGWVCSCSCMTARAWPASVIRHSTGSPGAEGESLFDFLLSSFLIASKATKCCCSFYRTNWRLAVTILWFLFSPQFVQKWNIVIDFNCITADSEKTLHCRKVIRCLTFFFLLL